MKKSLCILSAALLFASATVTVQAQGKSEAAQAAKPGPLTIVGNVTLDDEEFDVLEAAVVRAGLVDALNGKRQLTVFAPTDAAFVATLNVADENAALDVVGVMSVEELTDILLYHVIPGRRTSTSVLAAPSYRTLGGATLTRAELAAAGIAATDLSASNGVIHIINSVLIPD